MGGQRGASHKRVELVMKLPQLQNLIKRDSAGYKEEFLQQHRELPKQLMSLLEEHGAILTPAIRVKLVQALVLLRNRAIRDKCIYKPAFALMQAVHAYPTVHNEHRAANLYCLLTGTKTVTI
eukprot:5054-Heterococcus_DN1.PRE.3